jgi:hypothetical protein
MRQQRFGTSANTPFLQCRPRSKWRGATDAARQTVPQYATRPIAELATLQHQKAIKTTG